MFPDISGLRYVRDFQSQRPPQCKQSVGAPELMPALILGAPGLFSLCLVQSDLVLDIQSGATLLGTANKSFVSYPEIYTRVGGTMQKGRASLLNGAKCLQLNETAVALHKPGDQCLQV